LKSSRNSTRGGGISRYRISLGEGRPVDGLIARMGSSRDWLQYVATMPSASVLGCPK